MVTLFGGGAIMLLYIGDQQECYYLQELSDQLQEPICMLPAPEDPVDILQYVKAQYSHYIVNIGSYMEKSREIIYALKQLVGIVDGTLILLAVNMTTETSIISELLYAGFTNIIFGHKESDSAIISTNLPTTAPLYTEPIKGEHRFTEPMLNSYTPYYESPETLHNSRVQQNSTKAKGNKWIKRGLAYGGCVALFLIVLVFLYQRLVTLKDPALPPDKEVSLVEDKLKEKKEVPATIPVTTAPAALFPVLPREIEQLKETEQWKDTEEKNTEEKDKALSGKVQGIELEKENPKEDTTSKETTSKETTSEDAASRELPNIKKSTNETKKNNQVVITYIKLPSSIRMVTGVTIKIDPEYQPSSADQSGLTWKSNNSRIATVRNGKITANRPGVVVITVRTREGKKATCKVTIANQ